eukprot:762861-Hanusia_phi.AAC.1
MSSPLNFLTMVVFPALSSPLQQTSTACSHSSRKRHSASLHHQDPHLPLLLPHFLQNRKKPHGVLSWRRVSIRGRMWWRGGGGKSPAAEREKGRVQQRRGRGEESSSGEGEGGGNYGKGSMEDVGGKALEGEGMKGEEGNTGSDQSRRR